MIIIQNISTVSGETKNYKIKSDHDQTIDGSGLTLLPALIDPHVHFRVPGGEHKEDWETGATAAIAGGVTTVLDMPNNSPSCISLERIKEKKSIINKQLDEVNIPLRYGLYLGADVKHLDEIGKVKSEAVGIKIYMGASTGDLLIDQKGEFEQVCKLASAEDKMVVIHAEDQKTINDQRSTINDPKLSDHSRVRPREAAIVAVSQAIKTARKYGNKLYVLHVNTKEELGLIKQAKEDGLEVYAEVSPHHLFLNESDYERLGNKAKVNPPLRTEADSAALWEGIKNGTIDTVGTDHAPHTVEEKEQIYEKAPAGLPSIENYLALLLDAQQEGKITLEEIVKLTHDNPQKIFGLKPNDDVVLVDLNKTRVIKDKEQKTKCGWSPYSGMELKGWPVYTILKGQVYKIM